MAKSQKNKQLLSMAGEFGAASELMKRGAIASVTFGNAKAVDIYMMDVKTNSYKRIEVKTTSSTRFVTNFFQKYPSPTSSHPDFWILAHVDKKFITQYFILTHDEMAKIQMVRNKMSSWMAINGVDNVLLSQVCMHKDRWDKIL